MLDNGGATTRSVRAERTERPAGHKADPGTKDGYKALDVYQLAHKLGVNLHKFSLELPQYELYETGSQLRRASKSISANIVEGYGRRRYKAEFIRFLIFALASCDETAEWLAYVRDIHKEQADAASPLLEEMEGLGRKLNRFIQAVSDTHVSAK